MAAMVPNVPAATGILPVKNPVAINIINFCLTNIMSTYILNQSLSRGLASDKI